MTVELATFQNVGGLVLRKCDKKISNTTRLVRKLDPAFERELTISETLHHALAWKHILEPSESKMVSHKTVIFPAGVEGLKVVLSVSDIGADPRTELWETYRSIFSDI
jgi:hypothetical protein